MRIYLDNCCYNRPYDNLQQMTVKAEADSKRFIQSLISYGAVELAHSFVLLHEISKIPLEEKRENILDFITNVPDIKYVGKEFTGEITRRGNEIMRTGLKYVDAAHVACAILAKCDYFISTDKRLLIYKTDDIKMINPIDFEYNWRKENG